MGIGEYKQNFISAALILLAFLAGLSASMIATKTEVVFAETTSMAKVDKVVRVSCGTDSMGMLIDCNDKLYVRDIEKNEDWEEGAVYIFKSPYRENGTTVHRLVKDCRDNCTGLIFKGDNNHAADPVISEEDVKYKVMKVEYR